MKRIIFIFFLVCLSAPAAFVANQFTTNSGAVLTNAAKAVVGSTGGGAVDSVNGHVGTVVLNSTDIAEALNLYWTVARSNNLWLAVKTNILNSTNDLNTAITTGLASKVGTSRAINTTSPLSGGGALSSDLTLAIQTASGAQAGALSAADWSAFNGKISGNQTINLSGDASGSGTTAITVGVNHSTNADTAINASGTGTAVKTNDTRVLGNIKVTSLALNVGGNSLNQDGSLSWAGGNFTLDTGGNFLCVSFGNTVSSFANDGSGYTGTGRVHWDSLGNWVGNTMTMTNAGTAFTGNGGGLTNLPAQTNSNTALLDRNPQVWTGSNNIPGKFTGSGASLTNLAADQLATGTIPIARSFALAGDVTSSAGSATTTLANIPAISGANITSLTGANVTGTLPQTTYPVAVTNFDSRVLTFTNNVGVSNQVGVAGVLLGTNGNVSASGTISSTLNATAAAKFGPSGNAKGWISMGADRVAFGYDGGSAVIASASKQLIFSPGATMADLSGTTAKVTFDTAGGITVTGQSTIQTNIAALSFFPANPGNWLTALATRTTNGVRRATLEIDFSLTPAATGTPVVQVVIEQGTTITNTWTIGAMGGVAGLTAITNHYSFRLNPSAVVNATDISRGTGASVAISLSQLTSE